MKYVFVHLLCLFICCQEVVQAMRGGQCSEFRQRQLDSIFGAQYVKVVAGELYIGAKYNDEQDLLILFKKCMFNELMTFYSVGLACNRDTDVAKNPDRPVDVMLNIAHSDNIGPVAIVDGGWIGGNHSYLEAGRFKTAICRAYEFYADGKRLKDGDEMYAEKIEVRVHNQLYDPLNPKLDTDGAVVALTEVLIEEQVNYSVEMGNIFVEVSHTYKNDRSRVIRRYYGMQSMFVDETHVTTGHHGFESAIGDMSIGLSKVSYQGRFVEYNQENNTFQSSYLLPDVGLGNGAGVMSGGVLYTRAYGKSYHHLLESYPMRSGSTVNWAGLYTWFSPLYHSRDGFVYQAYANGKRYLFVDCFNAIEISLESVKFKGPCTPSIKQIDRDVQVEFDQNGLKIQAKDSGSALLIY
jgi:hypothetical protein